MIEGRIRKYYEEVVLFGNSFVMDENKIKIKHLVLILPKKNGETNFTAFKLFILGDGIEKKEKFCCRSCLND